jgi:hypothetical protein
VKRILKIYGLPRTGTNVLHWLLTVNFKNYVSDLSEFGTHYLGWKHGLPPSDNILEHIIKQTGEEVLFVFTKRDYDSWEEAVLTRHQNTWEFPSRFQSNDCFFFNTPVGFEVYRDIKEYHDAKQDLYEDFCLRHPDISALVSFENLQSNQVQVVETLRDKFNLELNALTITSIPKRINSSGHWEDSLS